MRSIHFDPDAWDDFLYWLGADRKMATRIARLIGDIQRDPFTGIGKPEPLKGDLSGYWSRRIDDEHRLVYRADDAEVRGKEPQGALPLQPVSRGKRSPAATTWPQPTSSRGAVRRCPARGTRRRSALPICPRSALSTC